MKKVFILSLMVLAFPVLRAENAAPQQVRKRLTRAEIQARIAARVQAEGGYVTQETQGRVVRFLSRTSAVPEADLQAVAEELSHLLRIVCEVSGSGKESASRTGCLITLVEQEQAPTLLIAPEEPWAVVNVKNLKKDNPSAELLKTRIKKELVRAFGFAMGAANSSMQPCLMRPVYSLGDLDAEKVQTLSPDPLMGISQTIERLNFARPRRVTYRKAVEEGWAPAPTNAVQQAIWDKMQAEKERGPTNGLQIPPPKK